MKNRIGFIYLVIFLNTITKQQKIFFGAGYGHSQHKIYKEEQRVLCKNYLKAKRRQSSY